MEITERKGEDSCWNSRPLAYVLMIKHSFGKRRLPTGGEYFPTRFCALSAA